MATRRLAALAILATAGTAFAQVPGGSASDPTKVEAEAVGPQDSIGTSGESPTKSMIQKGDRKDAQRRKEGEARRGKPDDAQDAKRGSARDAPPATGR
ncbi:hypothetical protein [Noviherbaspirillum aridicola]|uniref:Cell envelope biogenesis protein TolA n=1 Tax=Noviherbaspirillum aridicola TaxID=2849687 RepID=A0ABQ4Q695_9BURK|nr:hypothetical protein [Noviherbaspirillum aridicola]GIZ52737.1 hypothetical protein NCCP691_27510 [Noviherbaspirillum aridicola]